jgi:hypothetical protein
MLFASARQSRTPARGKEPKMNFCGNNDPLC